MDIGTKLRALRRSHGLSQEALAAQLGVSRQAVTKWESGTAAPSTANLLAICEAFQISPAELTAPAAPAEKAAGRPRLSWLRPAAGVLLVLLSAAAWRAEQSDLPPKDAIGYADGPTEIYLAGASLPARLLWFITALTVAATLLSLARRIRKRRKEARP